MKNLKEQFVGTTWLLKSYESVDQNDQVFYPLGEDATGYIVFDHTGLFSVQIMAKEALSKEAVSHYRTDVEKAMGMHGYHAYSGHFSLNEEKAVMTTSVELSLIPAYRGSKQKRSVNIEGDLLYLSNIEHPERKLVWQKKYNLA